MEEKDEELRPGAEVTSSLRLVARIGGGGMGSVWTADHLALDTRVAVKFIAQGLATDGPSGARFRAEAAAAAAVKSPHVVQVLDYGLTTRGTPYIVMELLEGHDLRAHIGQRGKIAPQETATIIRQVARALGKAHEQGIVHRDVKPENVFLCNVDDDEPFVKVLDFGIAKRDTGPELTTTGTTVGTPYYMSPEQLVGAKSIDLRSDLWALGVMTFYMLTGKRPFGGETAAAIAVAIHNARLPHPTEINPELPRRIDTWFLKACSRDPATRFSSAKELATTLADALGCARPQAPNDALARASTPESPPRDAGSDDTVQAGPRPSMAPTLKDPTPPVASVATLEDARSNSALSKSTAAISSATTARPSASSRVPWIIAAIAITGLGVVVALPLLRGTQTGTSTTATASGAQSSATTSVATETTTGAAAPTVTASATTTATTATTATPTAMGVMKGKLLKPVVSASAKPIPKPTSDELPELK